MPPPLNNAPAKKQMLYAFDLFHGRLVTCTRTAASSALAQAATHHAQAQRAAASMGGGALVRAHMLPAPRRLARLGWRTVAWSCASLPNSKTFAYLTPSGSNKLAVFTLV